MNQRLVDDLSEELGRLKAAGTYKSFNTLTSPMDAVVRMEGRGDVLVMSSNNYLGLASHPEVVAAGIGGLQAYGAGTASVRFICGTFQPHLELESELAGFLRTEAATTYVSCWNANEAVIPSLTDSNTVILSDALNHASIIDSIRLSQPARKVIYPHSDLAQLEAGLRSCDPGQRKLIITDGVFSMEGDLARLPEIVDLARRFDAVVVVDDSHGCGVLGKTGRGVAEHFGLLGEIDILTGTLGKALGGAAGGYVAGPKAVCDMLTQRSRPQLFSNALPPTVACSARAAIRVLLNEPERVSRLRENSAVLRDLLRAGGLNPLEGDSAIVPVIVGDTALAIRMSKLLLDSGVFVTGFGFPVVPEGTARIRFQVSAAHTRAHLEQAAAAAVTAAGTLGLL